MNKIILVGYMGSGKTAVAQKIATLSGLKCVDLDQIIEESCQMTVPEIFEKKGELFFRKKEHEIFSAFSHNQTDFVLSTGGGTPCYYNNHLVLQASGITSVYLKTRLDVLVERLSTNRSKRPMIAGLEEDELREFVGKHLFERSYYYNQAKHVVTTDGSSVEQVAKTILALI